MTQPQMKTVQCLSPSGLHRMAYWEWGARDNPHVVVCVHGLSRQGRDFDRLAQDLAPHCRVICPDVAGRGQSDRLANPALYQIPQYVSDMVALVARLDVERIDWVGTSMGGLIGMGLAAQAGTPVRRLVLNDVGPAIRFEALQRIGQYLGKGPDFESLEQGAAYLRSISAGFGPHSDALWLELSRPMFRQDGGRWVLHYDPRIALPFGQLSAEMAAAGETALWAAYDAIPCPTLLLRGAESDLLSPETAQAMTQRGPRAQLHELPGIGHAPTLTSDEQIALVRQFLLAP